MLNNRRTLIKVLNFLGARRENTHKGDYGKVLLVAGSRGMLGAGILASRAALRVGAGLVYLSVPDSLVAIANLATPEVVIVPYSLINKVNPDIIAIGPGIGQSVEAIEILRKAIKVSANRYILDADALNIFAKNKELITHIIGKAVITPHPGEMAKLLGKSIEAVQKDRIEITKEAARKFGAITVLKGNKTIVVDVKGKTYINTTGNPGMASAGMGDVLTGMIAGFAGQGISLLDASRVSVYLHGLAGDLCAKEKGMHGVIASDVVEMIPYATNKSI
jgi:NAD(P)H-hydrate epimerase